MQSVITNQNDQQDDKIRLINDIDDDYFQNSEPYIKDMTITQFAYKIWNMLKTSLIIAFELCLYQLTQLINLHFSKFIDNPYIIGGLGLANVIISTQGGVLIIGMNQAFSNLYGIAYAGNKQANMQNYLNKGLFCLIIIFILFFLLALFSKEILIILGQDINVSILANQYLLSIIPGLFANYLFDFFRNYLNAQHIYNPQVYILTYTIIMHYCLCGLLVEDYGIWGISCSLNVIQILNLIFIIIYMKNEGLMPSFQYQDLFVNLFSYLSYTLPIALPVVIDIFCFEINAFLIGALHNLDIFSAHISISNFVSFQYAIPNGMQGALFYQISSSIGSKDLHKTTNYYKLTFFLAFLVGGSMLLFIILFTQPILEFYSESEQTLYYMRIMLYLYSGIILVDYLQCCLQGITKAIGLGQKTLNAFTFSYYCIGTPMSIILCFVFKLSYIGIWIGFFISLSGILYLILKIIHQVDWKKQIYKLNLNLDTESKYGSLQ